MVFFLLLLIVFVSYIFIAGARFSAPRYRGPISDHFDGKIFFTPGAEPPNGFREVLKYLINRKPGPWKEDLTERYGTRPLAFERDTIRITFINHSTFLIQADGVNIITDPIFARRASPLAWAGPKRMRLPGIRFEDLPRIDVVLLSHNHYDHLDMQTIRMLFGGHHPQFITPLGVKAFLEQEHIKGATDLDWWESAQLKNGIAVQSMPAQHFSGRGLFDRNATLWCGYTLHTSKGVIYFAGDTGYNKKIFTEIASRVGPIKISLLPIGAYKPGWFMSPIHTSPEQSVLAHLDLKTQHSIASHFGTFPLADEAYEEPIQDLAFARSKHHVNDQDFVALQQGEVKIFD